MSLIAICPACNTHFSVVPDQLKISEGWVRCGKCSEVFDAIVHSSSDSNETFSMPLDAMPSRRAAAPTPTTPPTPTHNRFTSPPSFTPAALTTEQSYASTSPTPLSNDYINTDIDDNAKAEEEHTPDSDFDSSLADFDIDIDSSSPYLSVEDVLDSVPAESIGEEERLGFVQRWLRGRPAQPAPLNEASATYPTVEAQDSKQVELAEKKAQEQPQQRIRSVLETLDAIRQESPAVSEKPAYVEPKIQPQIRPQTKTETETPFKSTPTGSAQASENDASSTPLASPTSGLNVGTDTLRAKLERIEPSFKISEKFPWSSPDSTSENTFSDSTTANTADTQHNYFSASHQAKTAKQTQNTLPSAEQQTTATNATPTTDSLLSHPASGFGASVFEPSSPPVESEFEKSLKHRAEQIQSGYGSDFHDDGTETDTTIPSELAEALDSTLEEKIEAVRITTAKTTTGTGSTPQKETTDENPDENKELAFVKAAKRQAFYRSTPVRLFAYALCTLLAFGLFAQYAYFDRDKLAVQFPKARPALQKMCNLANCQLEAYRHIQSVQVESSGFTVAQGNRYRMTVGLRNRSHLPVAMPWIELTLTDSRERAILRRTFSSYELGIKNVQLNPNASYEGDVLVDINAKNLNPRFISGYKIVAFYP